MIGALIFDWGGTVMMDTGEPGPMFLWKNVSWVPGAREALEQLREWPCLIATNAGISDTEAMIRALKRVGADGYFGRFFSSKDLGYAKPDPQFFLRIASAGGYLPEVCVVIGNDYRKDICGAKQAGMKTVFYDPLALTEPAPMADAVITRMDQLPEVILKWKERE